MQVLHLDSSILGDASASRSLSAALVAAIQRRHPAAHVVYRDLVEDRIPHLDGATAAGFRPSGSDRFDAAALAEHARSERLVSEFVASELIVIGAPMYNFSVATQLKAWIDRVTQPGRTFKYTEHGPVGLAGGKTVLVASTRGGMYSEGPAAAMDFQEAYLQAMFGFMGIDDVRIVRAERLTKGGEIRAAALQAALDAIGRTFDPAAAA
jgi:FMN-dependent NADH-azoreductase